MAHWDMVSILLPAGGRSPTRGSKIGRRLGRRLLCCAVRREARPGVPPGRSVSCTAMCTACVPWYCAPFLLLVLLYHVHVLFHILGLDSRDHYSRYKSPHRSRGGVIPLFFTSLLFRRSARSLPYLRAPNMPPMLPGMPPICPGIPPIMPC